VLSFSVFATRAFAACKLAKMAELPVTMSNLKPLVTAQINGEDALFVADSGAFWSMITQAGAAEYKLKLGAAPFGLYINGVGGTVEPSIATVKIFTLAGIPVHNVEFLVGGGNPGRSESIGVLGQNLFRIGDVEYDLANGAIRLFHAEDCGHALLAYWVKPSESYSVMNIERATVRLPHTTGTAFINGAKISVIFDSGAGTSMLSMRAAGRAGVKPDTDGVVEAGYSRGIGRASIKTYIGRFSNFKIGDEEIRNTRLRFGDIDVESGDMLIGADFFLSHRIYVASS
jgi:predicted aspartyl protease